MEELIEAIKRGDHEKFRHVIERYQQPIFTYSYRLLGNRQDAEDATQEVFLKAFKDIDLYKENSSFSAWLYKIAYHHCLNKLRRQSIFKKVKQMLLLPTVSESTEKIFEKQLFSAPLSKALGKLSPSERNLIILRIFEEKSYEEMGEILQCSAEAAKKRYERVKSKLKLWLNESEDDPDAKYVFFPG